MDREENSADPSWDLDPYVFDDLKDLLEAGDQEDQPKGKLPQLESLHEEALKSAKQDRKERKVFGRSLLRILWFWIGIVLAILIAGMIWPQSALADSVLKMLLGTTTANIIGLLVIVVSYLFRK